MRFNPEAMEHVALVLTGGVVGTLLFLWATIIAECARAAFAPEPDPQPYQLPDPGRYRPRHLARATSRAAITDPYPWRTTT